jgi:ribosomal protein S18 acetylase RimI-like enzyme
LTAAAARDDTRIRLCRAADLDVVYRICLLTADSGGDATARYDDPQLPGHIYAAPYVLFEPSLAFVAEDGDGVGGYVLGALDSVQFARRLDRDWWPGLRRRYPEPPPATAAGPWTPQQFAMHCIHHPFPVDAELAERYPSHLHINLVPRLQARGLGSAMMTTMTDALAAQGSPGLHLHVSPGNWRAAGFYRRIGFTELPAAYARIFVMDLQDRRPGSR